MPSEGFHQGEPVASRVWTTHRDRLDVSGIDLSATIAVRHAHASEGAMPLAFFLDNPEAEGSIENRSIVNDLASLNSIQSAQCP